MKPETMLVLGAAPCLSLWAVCKVASKSSDVAVLTPLGTPVVTAVLNGCVPGQGCGTVTLRFRAVAPEAVVLAERTSCGEARLSLPAERFYKATVRVMP
jgi:hypothetical protein